MASHCPIDQSRPHPQIVLETERLILEELTDKHFEDLFSLLSNKVVHRHFTKTLNRKESEEFLLRVQERYGKDGFSFWAVVRKEDRAFLGICGLLKQHIDAKDEIEVGYRILDTFWGNGYGTEAARGCMEYARDVLKAESVISLIRSVNHQSIRVAEKNGLVLEKETLFHDLPHRVYRFRFGHTGIARDRLS